MKKQKTTDSNESGINIYRELQEKITVNTSRIKEEPNTREGDS